MSHQKAYSVLTVKAIDAERRILTGIATTPTPDRMGDIIDPAGVTFKNPLPLLLYHDSRQPVGTVKLDKPTKDGVTFTAQIAEIAEPGTLKDRVDEAWQSVKERLIRGVSIGFRVLNDAMDFMQDTGGIRFRETEILELSLVAIPANVDATISAIKSFDAAPAAPGQATRPVVKVTLPGVPGASRATPARPDRTMKTIAEQISAFEASRQAKSARMTELMTAAGEKGETLDATQTEEYDNLEAEVKSIDAHLTRLRTLEEANKKAAAPVAGADPAAAAAARGALPQISVRDVLPKGIEFARFAIALLASKGNTQQALEIARKRYPDQARIQTVLKSAVEAGTTTDPTWAGALVDYQNFAGDFIEFLRPATILGKFGTGNIPSLRRIPFNVKVIGQTSGGQGYWVGQGKAKPLTKVDFAPTRLGFAKVANIAVLSDELVRFSSPSAEALVRDAIAAAIVARMDIDFIDPFKEEVADVSPASITNGVTAIPSTGTDAQSVRTDLAALLGTYITANLTPASAVLIMSATTALALSLMRNALGQKEFPDITMNGGTLEGLPVIVSQYVAIPASPSNHIVVIVNASDVFLADDGQVVIDASREASLEMSDDPIQAAGGAGSPGEVVGATSMVSLWQANLLGLRAERFVNWKKRRPEAVAYLDGVNWSATGSPA